MGITARSVRAFSRADRRHEALQREAMVAQGPADRSGHEADVGDDQPSVAGDAAQIGALGVAQREAGDRNQPAAEAVGRVSVEMICPYPPGVPVLSPGERITEAALGALFQARDIGVRIAFVADPTLKTLKVLPA